MKNFLSNFIKSGRIAWATPAGEDDSAFPGIFAVNAETGERAWAMCVTYGEHPNAAGLQVFTKQSCADMVAKFNAMAAERLAADANWPGAPIYEGHPDIDNKALAERMGWTNMRPIGRVHQLRTGAKGLEALRSWNAEGEKNMKDRAFPFPSIHLNLRPAGNGKLYPSTFRSIGMWETPNVPDVPAWNAASAEQITADTATQTDDDTTTNPKTMDPKALAAACGLPETATPDEIMACIKDKCAAAAEAENAKKTASACNAELTTVKADLASITTERDAARKAETEAVNAYHEAVLDKAQAEGRLTPAMRDTQKALLAKAGADAVAAINALPVLLHTQRKGTDGAKPGGEVAGVNAATAQQQLGAKVAAYAKQHGVSTQAAFNAVWNDASNAALVKAAANA